MATCTRTEEGEEEEGKGEGEGEGQRAEGEGEGQRAEGEGSTSLSHSVVIKTRPPMPRFSQLQQVTLSSRLCCPPFVPLMQAGLVSQVRPRYRMGSDSQDVFQNGVCACFPTIYFSLLSSPECRPEPPSSQLAACQRPD